MSNASKTAGADWGSNVCPSRKHDFVWGTEKQVLTAGSQHGFPIVVTGVAYVFALLVKWAAAICEIDELCQKQQESLKQNRMSVIHVAKRQDQWSHTPTTGDTEPLTHTSAVLLLWGASLCLFKKYNEYTHT